MKPTKLLFIAGAALCVTALSANAATSLLSYADNLVANSANSGSNYTIGTSLASTTTGVDGILANSLTSPVAKVGTGTSDNSGKTIYNRNVFVAAATGSPKQPFSTGALITNTYAWTRAAATSANTYYYQFGFTVDAGYSVTDISISYDWMAGYNASGTTNTLAVDAMLYTGLWYSINGAEYVQLGSDKSVSLSRPSSNTNYDGASYSGDLLGLTLAEGDTITFQLAYAMDYDSTTAGSANLRQNVVNMVQNISVTGNVMAIPEPSTYALAGGILALGIALTVRRRRK